MGNITVSFDGVSSLIAAIEAIKPRIDAATRAATKETGNRLQTDARANFSGSHAPGWHHVGGDKPNTVSGHLQQSIMFLRPVTQTAPGRYTTKIGPTAIYSRVIELGDTIHGNPLLAWWDAQEARWQRRHQVTVPPRPFFTPARMSLAPKMESIFYAAWREAWHG